MTESLPLPPWAARYVPIVAVLFTMALFCGHAAGREPGHGTGPTSASGPMIHGWSLQSSAAVKAGGAKISDPRYSSQKWLPLSKPMTLMAGLLENDRYPHVFFGKNLSKVSEKQFSVNWWYRNTFRLGAIKKHHVFLIMNGVVGSADLWVNGVKVASRTQLQGPYSRLEYDITEQARRGLNAIALSVEKNDDDFHFDPSTPVHKHLSLNMVDWNRPSPDRYTGLQNPPELRLDGSVSIRDAHVLQKDSDDVMTADLTLKATLRNNTSERQRVSLDASVSHKSEDIKCPVRVTIGPGKSKTVAISRNRCAGLHLVKPAVWWPYQMGDQPLYQASFAAKVGHAVSDRATDTFGIRKIASELTRVLPGVTYGESGYRKFSINGVPFNIRGAGYSQDLFLRYSPKTAAAQISYVKNLGLNAIRFEGNFPPEEFFERMDRAGILAMPGWQCCDRWQDTFDTYTPVLKQNAYNQARSMAERLRDHASVFVFYQGSDEAPDPAKEAVYLKAFRAADWGLPQVSAANYRTSKQLGASGSKEGSYNYAPPAYWWDNGPESASTFESSGFSVQFLFNGTAWGFETETSAGNTIPTQDSLDRFMTRAEQKQIWEPATTKGPTAGKDLFHTADYTPYYKLSRLGVYNTALWNRYGSWSDLASYQRTVQLGEYEVARAQFEAFLGHSDDPANPSTGVIYWMLNKAWPSLQWSLFGHDFDQPGVYFGAQKANEPVHIMYAYDDGSIKVSNISGATQQGLTATVDLVDINGEVRSTTAVPVSDLRSQEVRTVALPPVPAGISSTYFAKLTLTRGSKLVSRNVYWLSTKPDQVDWKGTHEGFQGYAAFEPNGYADLSGLKSLGTADVAVRASTRKSGTENVTTVTIRNVGPNQTPVVGARADLFSGDNEILPIRWSENQVTLWPGEQQTLVARYSTKLAHSRSPSVRLSGYNVKTKTVGVDHK